MIKHILQSFVWLLICFLPYAAYADPEPPPSGGVGGIDAPLDTATLFLFMFGLCLAALMVLMHHKKSIEKIKTKS